MRPLGWQLRAWPLDSSPAWVRMTTAAWPACRCADPQETIAMNHLMHAHKNGGWVLLQNIHLTIDWTSGPLEKRIDKLADGAHPDFR